MDNVDQLAALLSSRDRGRVRRTVKRSHRFIAEDFAFLEVVASGSGLSISDVINLAIAIGVGSINELLPADVVGELRGPGTARVGG